MNSQFFKDNQPRPYNPTYVSSHIKSTMVFPPTYDLLHDYREFKITQKKAQNQQKYNPESSQSRLFGNVDLRHRRSKSNLSSYGSSSLNNLQKISDKDVFNNQKKKFNIINMDPNTYDQGIKMFPKLRNEVKEDSGNKMRQAFIMGKPEVALKENKKVDPRREIPSN